MCEAQIEARLGKVHFATSMYLSSVGITKDVAVAGLETVLRKPANAKKLAPCYSISKSDGSSGYAFSVDDLKKQGKCQSTLVGVYKVDQAQKFKADFLDDWTLLATKIASSGTNLGYSTHSATVPRKTTRGTFDATTSLYRPITEEERNPRPAWLHKDSPLNTNKSSDPPSSTNSSSSEDRVNPSSGSSSSSSSGGLMGGSSSAKQNAVASLSQCSDELAKVPTPNRSQTYGNQQDIATSQEVPTTKKRSHAAAFAGTPGGSPIGDEMKGGTTMAPVGPVELTAEEKATIARNREETLRKRAELQARKAASAMTQ